MKSKVLTVILILSTASAFAQKQITAPELVAEIKTGKSINYENVTIIGDVNLSNLGTNIRTAEYPEKGKTVFVLTNFIRQSIFFKDCSFRGKFILFEKLESSSNINEYRVEFTDNVIFQNCVFEKPVDFELTNFNSAVSFENTVFNERPRFVRMGLYQKPNIEGLKLRKGCLYQFDQSKKEKTFTTQELEKIIETI